MKLPANPVVEVPLSEIVKGRANTREFYDPEALDELTVSLGKMGQIYPVLLHRIREGKYELIIGSRRLKAARKAQWGTIASIILEDISDVDKVVLCLTENLHREDMTPFEEAKAILTLCKDHEMQPREVARRINKPVPWVKGRLKILSVSPAVQDLLCQRKVSINHVGILASLSSPKEQIQYARIVAKDSLSEQDLTVLIRKKATGVGPRLAQRPASQAVFTPLRLGLKVQDFNRFLKQKVKVQLALEGPEVVELKTALREVRDTIEELLIRARPRKSAAPTKPR